MDLGTLPTTPSGVTVSPAIGPIAGGGTVTVSGSDIAAASAIEIGTTAEHSRHAGGAAAVLQCDRQRLLHRQWRQPGDRVHAVPGRRQPGVRHRRHQWCRPRPVATSMPTSRPPQPHPAPPPAAPVPRSTLGRARGERQPHHQLPDHALPERSRPDPHLLRRDRHHPNADRPHPGSQLHLHRHRRERLRNLDRPVPGRPPWSRTRCPARPPSRRPPAAIRKPRSAGRPRQQRRQRHHRLRGHAVHRRGAAQPPQTINSTATTATITGLTPGHDLHLHGGGQERRRDRARVGESASVRPNVSPSLTFPAPPPGEVGVGYSDQLTVNDGTAPTSWSVSSGTLPPGLTLGPSTGLLSGTPTAAGQLHRRRPGHRCQRRARRSPSPSRLRPARR